MSNGAMTRIERSRAKIVAAAADVFLDHGFLGATMDQIAARADVSVQTVYSRFKSKEALFNDVVGELAGGATRDVEQELAALPEGTSPQEWLAQFALGQLRTVLTPRLMQLRRMVIGECSRFPQLGQVLFREGPGRAICQLTEAFKHYAATGELVISDPELAARQFNWLLMGGPTSEVMHLGESAIPDPDEMARHAGQTVDMFLARYAARKASSPNL